MSANAPFWLERPLESFTSGEWELLCDGCGKCCLHKLEDEETALVHYTDIACRLLDPETCRCSRYARRWKSVPDCLQLTPALVREISWLPGTCAYRLLSEGKPLPSWHPLVSGDPESVHRAGISTRGRVVSERNVDDDYEDHIVTWPE